MIRSPPTVGLFMVTETDAHHAYVHDPRVPRIPQCPTVWLLKLTQTDAYHANVWGPRVTTLTRIRSTRQSGYLGLQKTMRIMPSFGSASAKDS